MHDLIECLNRRKPLTTINNDQLIRLLLQKDSNPNYHKIQLLRETTSEDEYDRIKEFSHCVSMNATFNGWVIGSKAIAPSGFIYIDLDLNEEEGMDYEREFVVLRKNRHVRAAWMSIGGKGIGTLVHVSWADIDEDNFKAAWLEAASSLTGHGTNPAAIDRGVCDLARVNVLSYDPDLYHNPNSISLPKPDDFNPIRPARHQLEQSSFTTDAKKNIRFKTDLDDWQQDEQVRYIAEGKDFTQLYFDKHKFNCSERNSKLFRLACWILDLNPELNETVLCAWLGFINSTRCFQPLCASEIKKIAKSAFKTAITRGIYAPTRKKKVWFRPDAPLSPHEKMSISSKIIGKASREKTLERLRGFIRDSREKGVTVTQKSLSEMAGVHVMTVKRYWNDLKEDLDG